MSDISSELEFVAKLKNKPLQVPEELASFLKYIRHLDIERALEIGAGDGGTTEALSYFVSDLLISIDSGEPRFDVVDINNRVTYRYLKGDSHREAGPAEIAATLMTKKLDLLFIDGDHSYAGAKLDYLLYKDFVADGGLIVFHDIVESERHKGTGCNVHILWDELKKHHRNTEIITNGKWAGIGIMRHERYEHG